MKPKLLSLLLTASLAVASAVAEPSAPEKPEAKEIRSAAAQASYKQALEHLNNHDVSEAVIALVKAKQLAQAASDLETAAQSTAELVRINAALERHEMVVGLYDEFTKNHAGHKLESQVISNAMPSLIRAGRGEEALKRSEKVIVALGGQANADLEKAIFYYSMSFLEMNKDAAAGEKLIRRLNTWPRVEALPASIRVWLLIAKIDIAEDKKYFPQPPRDRINAFYADLMKLDRRQLPDYPLTRIVVYLHDRDKGADALPFAEEILSRKDADHKDVALYYKSVTLAKSVVAAKQEIAIKGFSTVIDELKSREYTDDAMHALGMLQIRRKQWAAAEKTLLRYVQDKAQSSQPRSVVQSGAGPRPAEKMARQRRQRGDRLFQMLGQVRGSLRTLLPSDEPIDRDREGPRQQAEGIRSRGLLAQEHGEAHPARDCGRTPAQNSSTPGQPRQRSGGHRATEAITFFDIDEI